MQSKSIKRALATAVFAALVSGGAVNAQAPTLPLEAGSWGGIVRAGPGMEHRRLASLREGERVTLLENTGVEMNGFPWFRIRYRGSREGYQWGGILCARGEPIAGIFQICR